MPGRGATRPHERRDVYRAQRQDFADAAVQLDADGIVALLTECGRIRHGIVGFERLVLPGQVARVKSQLGEQLRGARGVRFGDQQVQVGHRPLARGVDLVRMQRSALEGDERHTLYARALIDLLQERLQARLTLRDLGALLGQERLPACRPLPARARGHEAADTVHRHDRARDAPFGLGPRGGRRLRLRQLVRDEFGACAHCPLQRRQRQIELSG